MQKSKGVFWLITGLVLAVLSIVGWKGLEMTSTNDFCGSCHVMKSMYESSFHSVHRSPQVKCKDCHLPNENLVEMLSYKAYSGVKDVVSNTMGPTCYYYEQEDNSGQLCPLS